MALHTLPWLEKLYEILDVDDDATRSDEAFLGALPSASPLEQLSRLFHRHLPPESIDDFGELLESKGGEVLYHRLLVLSTVDLQADRPWPSDSAGPGSFSQARFLSRQRDYAKKGEYDREWFFADGKLLSRGSDGSTVIEIENVDAFVDAIGDRMLEDDADTPD